MTCCLRVIKPCLAQGAAVTFQFKDVNAATDFTGASEITFDIWQGGIAGTPLLSKTLSGGDITLPDNRIFQLIVTNAESQALPRGRHHCEAWVTLSGGERRLVGAGPFLVKDTRKHDP